MITTTKPDVVPEGKYSPKQTAQALGISMSALNCLFKKNILKKYYRAGESHPYVKGEDILEYW